jgi:phage terminase large subunit-like protein
VWDVEEVAWVVGFFRDVLRLNGGEHEGQPFVLEPWQVFIVGSLFGWKRKATGYRRFRVAFIETGKGSGKSPLAAGIALKCLVADGEPRAEVYAAAAKKDQAKVMFRDAVAMVKQSPALSSRLTLSGGEGNEQNIAHLASGSFFRPISSESQGRGQSGPRPHCAVLDEVHEHPTNSTVEFMRAGTKGRRQALIVLITNSGVGRSGVCWDHHEYATKVAAGDAEDDSYFGYVCGLDEGDDPLNDPSCWPKANPSMGVTFPPSYLEELVREARGMPSKAAKVLRLNFCVWVEAENPWIDGDLWRACERKPADFPTDEELRDRPCFLALDLSGKLDLTALAAVWSDGDGGRDARVWFWTPAGSMDKREQRDRVPYRAWSQRGHLFAVPGLSIDFAFIAQFLAEHVLPVYDVRALAFDPYRIHDFLRELAALGIDCWIWEGPEAEPGDGLCLVMHSQGFKGGARTDGLWMPRSLETLESGVLGGHLRVLENPVLRSCSASAVISQDAAENRMFVKQKSTGRIDGLVALAMGDGLADQLGEDTGGGSVYDDRGILFFG